MKSIFVLLLTLSIVSCNEVKEEVKTSDKIATSDITFKKGSVEPFNPKLFSQFINSRDLTMTSNEQEAYFTLLSPARELSVILNINKESDEWSTPEIASFSGQYSDLEPSLSPDGLKLYFASNRPISKDSTNTKDFDIWYVERSELHAEWSEPINLGAPVNSELDEFFPSVANSKNLYFTMVKKELESEDDIFMCEWKNGTYSEPIRLGESVNSKYAEYNAFIAPDESYLIFGGWRRPDGLGSGDLFISKRNNGTWLPAKNLGAQINGEGMEYCPFVNNGILYFTSRRSHVEKKDNGFSSYKDLLDQINRYDNGASRIYKVDIKDHIRVND